MAIDNEYPQLDAVEIAARVRKGDLEAGEVLEAAIRRAERLNPELNAIVDPMYDFGRHLARDLDDSAALAGVPFLLKDLNTYVEGTVTTGGSRFYRDYTATGNSALVDRYLAAGLVIFGKTASPEFGLTTSTESILFGKTHNPWSLEHTAGGSSGGAAAAVAAGIVPAAHASDGGGSIRIPAACCGLFGLKPSRGRVSMAPFAGEGWAGLSTVHAVSRTVRDSAALLDVAAGPVAGDPYWAPPPRGPYLAEAGTDPGRLRIGVITTTFNGRPTHPECVQAVHDAARLCADLGHSVRDVAIELPLAEMGDATGTIVGANIRANLVARSREVGREWTPDDVEPITWTMAENAKATSSTDYALAVRTVHRVGRLVAQRFADIDVLLTPTMATPPKRLGVLALDRSDSENYLPDLLDTIAFTQLMNVAGNPAASVPLHWSEDGLPVGVQFATPYGHEHVLFRLAAQLEEAKPWRDRRPEGFS